MRSVVYLQPCQVVHSNTEGLNSNTSILSAEGHPAAKSDSKQMLQHLPPAMLLAHLEKEKRHRIRSGQVVAVCNLSRLQI